MSGFSGGGKVQMRRIYAIVDAVNGGGYPNCRSLAERLEVTQKTVQRDVNFIRDQPVPLATSRSILIDLPFFRVILPFCKSLISIFRSQSLTE